MQSERVYFLSIAEQILQKQTSGCEDVQSDEEKHSTEQED